MIEVGCDGYLTVSTGSPGPRDRVLVADNFLASGAAVVALTRLVERAGATPVAIGAVNKKRLEAGQANPSLSERADHVAHGRARCE